MNKEVKVGTILISKPFMEDKRFEKTIILIVEHNHNETIGFIINKKSNFDLKEIYPLLSGYKIVLKRGGPVAVDNLFFIHKHPDIVNNCTKIKDGFFWGGDLEDIIKGLNNNEININDISFFIGYAGWEKDQLNKEIKDGSWIVQNFHLSILEKTHNWSDLLIGINKEYKVWATAPTDFYLN